MRAFSYEQLLALLRTARAHRERDWLLFAVIFNHGLRVTEAIGFTRDAVRDGELTIQRLKGSLRTVQALVVSDEPLLSERDPLIEFCARAPYSKPIFDLSRQRVGQLMHRYGEIAGLPESLCFPHALKHTVARLSIQDAGIEHVRQWLGHKSMSSTGEYLKVTDSEAGEAIGRAINIRIPAKV